MGENEEKNFTPQDFLNNNGFKPNDQNDPYNLKTPFGNLDTKSPFKSAAPNPWDQTVSDPFSGNAKKCPGCGSNLIFDVEIGSLICRTCGNLYDATTMEMNGSLGIETPEQEYGINDEIDYQDQGCQYGSDHLPFLRISYTRYEKTHKTVQT